MNKKINLQNILFILSLLLLPVNSLAQGGATPDLGFEFGMSKDEAREQIKSHGGQVIKNEVDTKEIRTLAFNGAMTQLPVDNMESVVTELEFFDDKLMSSALVVNDAPDSEFTNYRNSLIDYLNGKYGEPNNSEKMLTYHIWTWDLPDTKLVFSSNQNKGQLKLNYIYKPINQERIAKEISEKRKGGERKNPADQMFKDGDYSRPSNFPR